MLLGDTAFIAEARIWLTRHGGTISQQYPVVASAAMRFDQRLKRMPDYFRRAQTFAAAMQSVPGVQVNPTVPQANLVHLRFDLPPQKWEAARDHMAASERIWLGGPRTLPDKAITEVEIYVGEGLMALDDAEVVAAYVKLLQLAGKGASAGAALA